MENNNGAGKPDMNELLMLCSKTGLGDFIANVAAWF